MHSTREVIFTLRSFQCNLWAPDTLQSVLIFFVLNAEEFVLRDEGEVFHYKYSKSDNHLGLAQTTIFFKDQLWSISSRNLNFFTPYFTIPPTGGT
jgi:hypothetical protein